MTAPAGEPAVWVARAVCGCAKLVIIDRPEDAAQNADARAYAVQVGYTIVPAPRNWMTTLRIECPICRPERRVRPIEDDL